MSSKKRPLLEKNSPDYPTKSPTSTNRRKFLKTLGMGATGVIVACHHTQSPDTDSDTTPNEGTDSTTDSSTETDTGFNSGDTETEPEDTGFEAGDIAVDTEDTGYETGVLPPE